MDWNKAEADLGVALVDAVRQRLADGSSPQIDIQPLIDAGYQRAAVQTLFDALVAERVLSVVLVVACAHCGGVLLPQDESNRICPHCQTDFLETGEAPIENATYQYSGDPSREIPWLIAIHGFNTHGEWQEAFSWIVATRFRHRAPVLIFKFPFLSYGVLFKWRHRQLAADLRKKLETAAERAKASGIDAPPDIVAHSFGSLLFSLLLDRPDGESLRFGRVVLAGAIVRPDYDWGRHVRSGRIEAVLSHCSPKDWVVSTAQFFIPNSGPSGRVGFGDPEVLNIFDSTFSHGTAFEPATMEATLKRDGPWDLFLRLPIVSLATALKATAGPATWLPSNPLLTLPPRWLAIVLPIVVAIVLLAAILFPWVRLLLA